jgi:hypothetical protein
MKNINTRIQEKLVLNKSKSSEAHEGLWGDIEMALPDLEAEMHKALKENDPSFKPFDFGLTVDIEKDRRGNDKFVIKSDSLIDITGPLGKMIYEKYMYEAASGSYDETDTELWFTSKFWFKYKGGGSNGADAFWSSLYFDINEKTFIFGRSAY